MGEIEYNFKNMIADTKADRQDDMEWLNALIHETVNDEFVVYQKQEATRKLLISQINFLKQRLKVEIESREKTDEDIQKALDKYKELIQEKILQKRNDIKKRE